ncbi:MAG: DUF4291 domain-containing protein [Saprospiraceae bacterium]|nr:DUF4291 domain-containing protein [Saprospiraceae bacterium]
MNLKTIAYIDYETKLPQSGNWIVGQEKNDSLIVYQAYNPNIAKYAVANQKFGGNHYSFSRMTWIKPNFLWMMYRAGWATKVNQERILAIKMSKKGFLELLNEGVYTSYQADKYDSHEAWKEALGESEVRIQWDPDHDPRGNKLDRRAVQIGMKGSIMQKFNDEFIEEVTDITEFVAEQKVVLDSKPSLEGLQVMYEEILNLPSELKDKYSIPESFTHVINS